MAFPLSLWPKHLGDQRSFLDTLWIVSLRPALSPALLCRPAMAARPPILLIKMNSFSCFLLIQPSMSSPPILKASGFSSTSCLLSSSRIQILMFFGYPFVYCSCVLKELFSSFVKTASIVESIINDCLGLPPNFLSEYNNDR